MLDISKPRAVRTGSTSSCRACSDELLQCEFRLQRANVTEFIAGTFDDAQVEPLRIHLQVEMLERVTFAQLRQDCIETPHIHRLDVIDDILVTELVDGRTVGRQEELNVSTSMTFRFMRVSSAPSAKPQMSHSGSVAAAARSSAVLWNGLERDDASAILDEGPQERANWPRLAPTSSTQSMRRRVKSSRRCSANAADGIQEDGTTSYPSRLAVSPLSAAKRLNHRRRRGDGERRSISNDRSPADDSRTVRCCYLPSKRRSKITCVLPQPDDAPGGQRLRSTRPQNDERPASPSPGTVIALA